MREIGRQHGITDAGINKRAKKLGWTRDLTDKVRAQVKARLVRDDSLSDGLSLPRASDAQTVAVAASRGVEIVRQHRKALRDLNDLGARLYDELHATTTKRGELIEMIEAHTADDKSPKRRDAMMKAVELPGRIGAFKDLSMAIKNLLPLERQAFNLDADEANPAESLTAILEAIHAKRNAPKPVVIDHEPV